MKQWKYAWGWKAAALVVNQFCAVAMVLSIVLCTIYVGSGGIGLLRQDRNFEDTEYYRNEVREQVYRCIRAASRESKFENRGAYDAAILVNLEDYVDNNRILDGGASREGVYYKLTDLLNWGLDGYAIGQLLRIEYQDGRVSYSMQGSYTQTVVSTYRDGHAVSSMAVATDEDSVGYSELSDIWDGGEEAESPESYQTESLEPYQTEAYSQAGVQEQTAEEAEALPSEEPGGRDADPQDDLSWEVDNYLNNGESTILRIDTLEAVEERYQPVGYASLVDYAQKNGISASELQGLYHDLEEIIPAIYNDYYAYKENLELFSPSMTNMRYMILPEKTEAISSENFDRLTYTNLKAVPEGLLGEEDFLEYFRGYKDYLIYNTRDMSLEGANIPLTVGDVSNYLKGYVPSLEGDYTFLVAIDPAYQANDNLQAYKQQFDELKPVGRLAFYGVFIGSVLYFLSLVYLTLAAGHRPEDGHEVVHLNWFDRIKTELGALLVCVPAGMVLGTGVRVIRTFGFGNLQQNCLVGGVFLFILNFFFLWGYLSLTRRVKGRTIWTNSIFCAILHFLNEVVASRRMTTRTLVEYLLFLATNCILLCFNIPGFLLACILDAAVGFWLLRRAVQRQMVLEGIYRLTEGELDYQIPLEKVQGDLRVFAEAVNHVGEGLSQAVAKSVKDEKLKSDLITNVSHDIKTPLTSIINYVDLLKREEMPSTKARSYIGILEEKAQRLKHLTEDLVEASKISSGNVTLEFIRVNFQELIQQTNGEFYERFAEKNLQIVTNMPEEPVIIEADGRRLWRVIENVYNNVAKYAMPGTRVYVDMTVVGHMVRLNVKNISEQPLNIDAGQLTERFIRGDVSRSTEGSGLGLSIAKNLTQLQKGSFEIYLDGDLFRVTIIFPVAPEGSRESEEVLREEIVASVEAEGLQPQSPEKKGDGLPELPQADGIHDRDVAKRKKIRKGAVAKDE